MSKPAWRTALRRGSFRGAAFHTEERTGAGGRRLVRFEYPKRDTPANEHMGRRQRTWSPRVYVVGPNYLAERDALIEALEAAGSGRLVDHFGGAEYRADCETFDYHESSLDGGYCAFNILFVEAGGGAGLSTVAAAAASLIGGAAAGVVTAAVSAFEGRYGR